VFVDTLDQVAELCFLLPASHVLLTPLQPYVGKKLAFVDTHALDQLAELLKRGCDIADGCGRPGWLPRMALNEKTFEEFKHVHDTILNILQVRLRIHSRRTSCATHRFFSLMSGK
jgi:hypothetical protein